MSTSAYILIVAFKLVVLIALRRNNRIWQGRKRKELDLISYPEHSETDEEIQQRIISIACPGNSNKIFLLKTDKSATLFIESVDLDNNVVKCIPIDENLGFQRGDYKRNKNNDQITLFDNILTFFVSDNLDYIFLKLRLAYRDPNGENTLNIKIDLEGATLKKEYVKDQGGIFPNFDHLNGLVVLPDYNFFNTETFRQVDLYEFFDEYFEYFGYLDETLSERSSSFATPAKNLFGMVSFEKDEDAPRGTFCVFEIDGDMSAKLIFKYKIDECGWNHTFSENGKKIAYFDNRRFDEIDLVLRSLNTDEFENETRFTIYFSKESRPAEEILLTDHDYIVIVFPDRFEVYSADNEKRICRIERDNDATYKLANNTLFYLHDLQLKIHNF